MSIKCPLTCEDFNTFFTRFNSEVYAGKYSKIAYKDWKLLTRSISENKDFNLIFHSKARIVQVFVNHVHTDLIFKEDDKSFGTFLFKSICVPIENNNTTNNKENNTMKFNFDFGPVNPSTVRMSMYGMAVKNKTGTWVSYDAKSGEIMDVDVFNFDGAKFLYRMPVAIKDIAIGDVVIHNGAPMFVVAIPNDGKALTVVDVVSGERKDIMLAKSPFGFNFATKVVNFLNGAFNGTATEDNPFGNVWMLMAMSGDNGDMNDMLPMLMMANGNLDMSNPMLMFMALSQDKGNSDMLPWLLMSQSMNAAPAHVCKCGGNCGEAHNKE